MRKYLFLFLLLSGAFLIKSSAQTDDKKQVSNNVANPMTVSGQWFIANQSIVGDQDIIDNLFTLKRGYLTFKKDLNETFSIRFTEDITMDQEGSDAGNIELRMKYLYLQAKLDKIGFLENYFLEVGMVHRPWLDFEEHINHYRVQGTMFVESNHLINSADLGVNFVTLLGGQIDESYQKNVNSKYPGKYGSLSIGVFNGGGYHALENNRNKTLEARITLRPLPSHLPGLQLSYHGIYGKGNKDFNPDFNLNLFFASYESERTILTAQYYRGLGNSGGSFLDIDNLPYGNHGASFFGELYLIKNKLSMIGSYSFFDSLDGIDHHNKRWIGGIC